MAESEEEAEALILDYCERHGIHLHELTRKVSGNSFVRIEDQAGEASTGLPADVHDEIERRLEHTKVAVLLV